jgi:phosphatidylinositol-3-phosphatase
VLGRLRGTLVSGIVVIVVMIATTACTTTSSGTPEPAPSPTSTSSASVSTSAGASGGHPHVMVIVEENRSLDQIVGDKSMPYLNSLANSDGLATHWSGLSHPSLPNYLGLISGSIQDDPADTTPAQNTYAGPTLVNELSAAGYSWKAYMEDMPMPCDLQDNYAPGHYDVNHNPFLYFRSIRDNPSQCQRDVPFSQFAPDLKSGSAPDFIWVSPNTINDMHDDTFAEGDAWLARQIPLVLASSWYRAGGVVIITFDEGETAAEVATIVISAHTSGGKRFASVGNHYGTLRAIEETYHVPLLGNSAQASNGDLRPLF